MNTTLRLRDGYDDTSPHLRNLVRELQAKLTQNGFLTSVDGYYGPATEESVSQFQAANHIQPDGIAGPRTWAAFSGVVLDTQPFESSYAREDASMLAQAKMAQRYEPWIAAAAKDAGVPVAIICGIGSRESHWGLALRPPGPRGTGDFIRRATPKGDRVGDLPPDGGGFGRGLMQIDYDAHAFARGSHWGDPAKNIAYGGEVLRGAKNLIRRRVQGISEPRLLAAALAGYNCGPGNVLKAIRLGRDIDYFTHGRDYSRDVLERAGWFQLHGW